MKTTPDNKNSTIDAVNNIQFSDIFNLMDIQHLQDLFSDAHGVASIITHPDGTPISKPSNFCRLCINIIRKTGKGRANCFNSDAEIGKQNSYGPIVQPCLSGGLWDAGVSITVGGKHIANWLIGQVRNDELDEQRMIQYADEIGANKADFMEALNEVPVMSLEQFKKVSKILFAFANELSEKAYNNLQLKMQMTEREKATTLLQESEARFQLLFNQAPLGYQSLDFDGNFVEVNQQWLDTLGFTREEVIGKWFGDFLSPEYRKEFRKRFQIFKAQGKIHSEFEMVHKNGNKLFMAFEGKIGYDLNGEFKQTHCVLQDITDIKLSEKQVKLLSRAIEQSPVAVMIADKEGIIEYVNPKFTEQTGYSIDEIKGRNPRFLQSGQHTREFYDELWKTILSGKDWHGEFHNKKKNGESLWESTVISSILNSQGDISSFIAIKEDITEKKKMVEDLIKAKEYAEEGDKLKTAFLNNISHEIRTPFNGILGFLSIIQEDDLTADERDEYISIINTSAYRLMNTINDIVEISQIQAGQIRLTTTKTNINRVISDLYNRFKTDAESKGLKFFLNKNLPNSIECIYTDSIKLSAILSNLISNAIKFTKVGSIIFSIRKNDDYLEFSLQDTGIGIPADKQSAIFERFIQADFSNTRQFEGSGLGLSIATAYTEMLGGKIWVESEEGKGSIFYFTIPYISELKEKNVIKKVIAAEGADNQIKTLKILIAEDDEESAILLAMAVKIFGKEVMKVKTGVEAIETCRSNPDIDLVLMDIQMPDMDGYEATRQIRQFNRDVIIIAQTAYALMGDQEKSIAAGCNDYISKPIKKEQLVMLVEKYFKK